MSERIRGEVGAVIPAIETSRGNEMYARSRAAVEAGIRIETEFDAFYRDVTRRLANYSSESAEFVDPEPAFVAAAIDGLTARAEQMFAARCSGASRDASGGPPLLGGLVERLRQFEVHVETDGKRLVLREATGARKGLGAWYTPASLTEQTVRWTLEPLLERSPATPPRVCDPAMGGGAFLVASLRFLLARRGIGDDAASRGERGRVAMSSLFGLDVDPLAVASARLALWVEVNDDKLTPDDFADHLRLADTLLSIRPGDSPPDATSTRTRFDVEFPEVFGAGSTGFDALVGNPPWDIRKPNSREFFATIDPSFRRRAKGNATTRSDAMMRADPELRRRWEQQVAAHQELSKHVRDSYRFQGKGDVDSYQLFIERGLDLLAPGGRLGLIVPSGIVCDKGGEPLRRHLVQDHRLERMFMFTNRDSIFEIHRSYRFGLLVVEKGGETDQVAVAFNRHAPRDLVDADSVSFPYPRPSIERFSPGSFSFLELKSERERDWLERVYDGSTLVGTRDDLRYRREFDLTNDRHLFVDSATLGNKPIDRFGCVDGADGLLVPLYQGVMVRSFDCAAARYRGGVHRGTKSDWDVLDIDVDSREIRARYYLRYVDAVARLKGPVRPRLAFRDVQNATNERTFLGAILPPFPCGNTLPTLTTGDPLRDVVLLATLSSFVVDRVLRLKMSQNHVNWFYVKELPLPRMEPSIVDAIELLASTLVLGGVWFAREWERLRDKHPRLAEASWEAWWCSDRHQRIARRGLLDGVIAWVFGLDLADFEFLLADCGHDATLLAKTKFRRDLDPKGFWRVDRDLPSQQRLPASALQGLRAVEEIAQRAGVEGVARLLHAAVAPSRPSTPVDAKRGWDDCRAAREAFDRRLFRE